MSLQTDTIFVLALQDNASLISRLPAGDVYNTSIALPDEDLPNAPLPYIVVSFDGLANDVTTKDTYEGETDSVTVSITIAARNRSELAELAEMVRATVRSFFEQAEEDADYFLLVPLDYSFSAGAVQYDPQKPSFWQQLTWVCDTNI